MIGRSAKKVKSGILTGKVNVPWQGGRQGMARSQNHAGIL